MYLLKVLLYIVAAAACVAAFKHQKQSSDDGGVRAYVDTFRSCLHAISARGLRAPGPAWRAMGWLTVALLCVGLAGLRLVDIDQTVRGAVLERDWYSARSTSQLVLVATFALAGVATLLALVVVIRKSPPLAAAISTATGLWFFVAIRVVSIHSIDRVLGAPILGVTVNAWVEGIGILGILGAVFWAHRVRPAEVNTAEAALVSERR